LCERRARVVQREAGASSQKAFAAAVAAEGGSPLAGPLATGHVEVAQRVAHGATAGVTMEPAAISRRLAFAPLEEHVAEIWIDGRWRDHPAVPALGELLRSAAFTARLALVGGYQLTGCGSPVPAPSESESR
jgi:molybdate-binding protein